LDQTYKSAGVDIEAGAQRTLRQGIDDVWLDEESRYQFGNPGSGIFYLLVPINQLLFLN
jgi:hypothetical protein